MNKYVLTKFQNYMIAMNYADQQLTDLHLYEDQSDELLGQIVVGRVQNLVPNIQAAFVQIQDDITCYLSTTEKIPAIFCNSKNSDKICQGDLVLVQVEREALKSKAPSVTSNITLTGKYIVIERSKPGEIGVSKKILDKEKVQELKIIASKYQSDQYNIIVRTQAKNVDAKIIESELCSLSKEYLELLQYGPTRTAYSVLKQATPCWLKDLMEAKLTINDSIITDNPKWIPQMEPFTEGCITLYEDSYPIEKLYRIEDTLNGLLQKYVWLKSGASLVIEPCETMTVIDINTAKAIRTKDSLEDTYYKINCEAAIAIAREIRLRNISGMILIDFINMKDENHNKALIELLKKEISSDIVRCQYIDMTGLGLIELTRAKKRKPIYEIYKRKYHE